MGGEGPGGVGGADVGSSNVGNATSSSGCSASDEYTNQHCYLREVCDGVELELECEINGGGPWTCWCYQSGDFVGSCSENQPSCETKGCCESFWVFPG